MSQPKAPTQVAWIGLGNMGRGMVKNLVEKAPLSNPLIIQNRTQKRADDLAATLPASKVKVVSSIADAVNPSDMIFTCVGDDAAIQETISAALKSAHGVKGKIFVDCSTIHPDTTRKLAKDITAAGAHFVACPVFGAPAMADAGQLITVLAGPQSTVALVKPYTKDVMARMDIDLSFADDAKDGAADYGKALLLKVIGNTFVLQMVEALSEGHVVAEKTGLGGESLNEFIKALFPGPYTAYSQRLMSGDYHKREEPLFAVDLARKDARHAMDLASSVGARMKAVEVADAHLKAVKEHAGAKGDIAGIYGAVRQEAGLKFENDA